MNRNEFRAAVSRAAPPSLPRRYLNAAVELYLREPARGGPGPEDIPDCVELARVIRSSLSEHPERTDVLTDVPAVMVDSNRIARAIRPTVEIIREMLFGGPEPPFSRREDAVRWLRTTAAEQDKPGAKAQDEGWKMVYEAQSLMRKPVLVQTIALSFIDPDTDELEHLEAFFGSPIHVLAGQVEALEGMSGFSRVAVLDYILLGADPLIPAFRIKPTWVPTPEHRGDTGHLTRSVSVEINTRHLTEQQFRKIFHEVGRAFSAERKKPARARTVLLTSTVSHCLASRPEGENKTEFWKRVQEEFNSSAGRKVEKYRTWQAPRRTYLRLTEMPEYEHLPLP